jgi:hypothetical protein
MKFLYDMKKSELAALYNEILQENETNIVEGPRGLSKIMKSGEEAKRLAKYVSAFGLDASQVARAMDPLVGLTELRKEVIPNIKTDIKNNVRVGDAGRLGKEAQAASNMLTIKELNAKPNQVFSKNDIKTIMARNDEYVMNLAKKEEGKLLSKGSEAGGKVGGNLSPELKAAEDELLKNPRFIGKFKRGFLGMIKARWALKLLLLAGVAGAGLLAINYLRKKIKPGEEESTQLPPCILDLLSKEGCIMESTATTEGDPVVILTKTGNPEYDKAGGLKFYMDGTVTYGNGSRKGRWQCKGQKAEIIHENDTLVNIFENIVLEEEFLLIERDINAGRVGRIVRRVARRLKDDIGRRDLQTAFRVLNRIKDQTYEGQDAVSLVMQDYTRLHNRDIVQDVQSVTKGLDQRGIKARKDLLALLQSKATEAGVEPGVQPGTSTGDPLDKIDIKWDDGSTVEPKPEDKKPEEKKSKYTPCHTMPFSFGCNNDRIREMQVCLGLAENLQTGNFGPITLGKLKEAGYDLSNGITEEIYLAVLKGCNKIGTPEQPQPAAQPQRVNPIEKVPTGNLKVPTNAAPKINSNLRPMNQSITPERQKEIIGQVKGNRYVGTTPLNNAEQSFLNDYMSKLKGVTPTKEKVKYGGQLSAPKSGLVKR